MPFPHLTELEPERPGPRLRKKRSASRDETGRLGFLIETTARSPWNPEAYFRLGIALAPTDAEGAAKALERAIQIDATYVLRLLSSPGLASVLRLTPVQRVLERVRREHERRAYAGYA